MFKVAGKEKPKLKCPELEDDAFEARREGMQQFKTAIKNLSAQLPQFRSNVKALTAPLEALNGDAVELYDWHTPGSSERAVRMETTTAAVLALAQTHAAATKELAEYLEKRNTELGQLRAQVAERDKLLQAYDAAQYALDEARKKAKAGSSKASEVEEKRDLAKAEYESVHRIIDAELRELQATKFVQFHARYDEFQAAQVAFFSGMRNAWQLLFLEDFADTVAVPTPANILEKRRQWRDKSDKKATKDEQKALKSKLATEKKRVKAEKKASKRSGVPLGANAATAAAVSAGADGVPLACQVCHKRKVKARVAIDGQVMFMCKTCTVAHQETAAANADADDDANGADDDEQQAPPKLAAPKPNDSAPPPPPPKKKKSLPPPPPGEQVDEEPQQHEQAPADDDEQPDDETDESSDEPVDLDSDTDVSEDEEEHENELASAASTIQATSKTAAALVIDDPFASDPFALTGAVMQPTAVLQPMAVLQPTHVLQPTAAAALPLKPTRKVSQAALPTPAAVAAPAAAAAEPEFSRAELDGLTRRAGSWLAEAIKQLESGAFADAMLSANEAILCAAPACAMAAKGGTPDELQQRRVELRLCVAYELAARTLCHIGLDRNFPVSAEDAEPTLRATRARFIADIPLRTAHRTACVRAGLKVNAEAKNWGVAADLIKMLLPLDPPDKDRLLEQGRYCQAQGMTNASITPYKFMCFKQLRPITDTPMRCNICNALFASATVRGRSACPICKHGECSPTQ